MNDRHYKPDLRLNELKDIHKGEKCWIIGNGPSIKNYDLSKIKDEYVFVCNDFHMHDIWKELEHPYYFESSRVSFITGNFNQWKLNRLLSNNNAKFFYRVTFRELNELFEYIPKDRVYYMRLTNDKKVYKRNFEWNVNKEFIFANSVLITFAFPIACWMGFKDIYLLGCDHTNYFNSEGEGNNAYFYDWTNMPIQFWPNPDDDNVDHTNMLNSWKYISEIIKPKGINIYNASDSGRLDVFPRVKYEDIVNSP